MRARVASLGLIAIAGAIGGCRGSDAKPEVTVAAGPPAAPRGSQTPPPPAGAITACERYADALVHTADIDDDAEVRALLRNQGALLRVALRAPAAADRDELTVRCTTGLLDLARVPRYAGISGGVVGGMVAAPPAPPPPPTPRTPVPPPLSGLTPECQRLIDLFDRLASCPSVSSTIQDSIRQARSIMFDSYSQMPPDVRASMEDSCRTAADAYDQMLASYHCQ